MIFYMRSKCFSVALLAIAAFGLLATFSLAADITLQDRNSTVVIDPTSSAGMKQWALDGRNFSAQQWFWLRMDSEASEKSLDQLAPVGTPIVSDSNNSGLNDTVVLNYLAAQNLAVSVTMTLRGGTTGSGKSDIGEQISFHNNGTSPVTMHFFQFCNFTLSNGQDTVQMYPLKPGKYGYVEQTNPDVGIAESITSGNPEHHQAGLMSDSPSILTSLQDSGATTLSNVDDGPFTGNACWAFEWDKTIAAGDSFLISKDKSLTVVPEPANIVLLSIFGTCLFIGWTRSKRAG